MLTLETDKQIAFKHILFATDFSDCSNTALPYAIALTRRYGAILHSIHVRPTTSEMVLMSPEIWPMWVEEEEQQTGEYIERLERQLQGVSHEVLTARGNAAEGVAQFIEPKEIDLLVLGTHGRAGAGKLFFGSIAEEIFRRAPCPVLSIGPHVRLKPTSEIGFHRLLFLTDFSNVSLEALPYALSLAEEYQSSLTLLHVVERTVSEISDWETTREHLMRRLKQLVQSQSQLGYSTECVIERARPSAPPGERILELAADRSADLVVFGVRPHRDKFGLKTHFTSTTAQILASANFPILTLRGGFQK